MGCGYVSLANTVRGYMEIGQLPTGLNCDPWDVGDGIENTLRRRQACWHGSCRQQLHGTKLDRLRMQVQSAGSADEAQQGTSVSNEDNDIPCKRMKRTTISDDKRTAVCFFCDKPGDNLRQVMTFQLDERVRKCASLIGDNVLLGKLMAGDLVALEAKYHPGCLLSLYR